MLYSNFSRLDFDSYLGGSRIESRDQREIRYLSPDKLFGLPIGNTPPTSSPCAFDYNLKGSLTHNGRTC